MFKYAVDFFIRLQKSQYPPPCWIVLQVPCIEKGVLKNGENKDKKLLLSEKCNYRKIMHYSIFDKLLLYRSFQKGKLKHIGIVLCCQHKKAFLPFLLSIVDIQYVIIGKKAQKRSQCALVGKIVRRENVNIVGF